MVFFIHCLISMVISAQASEAGGIQEISRAYQESQKHLKEAQESKSIERVLRILVEADEALQKTKKFLRAYQVKTPSEQRMINRIQSDLEKDDRFLREMKFEMGLAEVDSIASYITLRRSLIQDQEQVGYVIKMDHQLLKNLEVAKLN